MGRPHPHQDDVIARLKLADAMHNQNIQQVPPSFCFALDARQMSLSHPRVVFKRHRIDCQIVVEIAHRTHKTRRGAELSTVHQVLFVLSEHVVGIELRGMDVDSQLASRYRWEKRYFVPFSDGVVGTAVFHINSNQDIRR